MTDHEVREDEVFVFGSNQAGRHGKGAAKHAYTYHGARLGVGMGYQASADKHCYAIPTKDRALKARPLDQIDVDVKVFLSFARLHPELGFFVTRVGCGLAGFTDEQMAPLFKGASANCRMPPEWEPFLR